MEVSFPKAGAIGMALVSFVAVSSKTILGDFFRWLPFISGIYNFVVFQYEIFMTLFFVVFFFKWTRNVYVLMAIGVMFFLFLKFLWL